MVAVIPRKRLDLVLVPSTSWFATYSLMKVSLATLDRLYPCPGEHSIPTPSQVRDTT
jgi:hypothetical protein